MSSKATLSVWGMYTHDTTLFDNLVVPTGITSSDVVENILLNCAEMQVLYSDFDFLKWAIGVWSEKELVNFNRVKSLAEAEYNPLENYDRYENISESAGRDKNLSEINSGHSTQSANGETVSNSSSSTGNTSVNEHTVAGYNAENYVSDNKDENTDNSNTASNDSTNSSTSSNSSSDTVKQNTEKEQENKIHNAHLHGNIGVTTPAQMIEGELSIIPKINVIDYIVNSFKNRFCLLVY